MSNQREKTIMYIVIFSLILSSLVTVLGLTPFKKYIFSNGSITEKSLVFFWDQDCTTSINFIAWENLVPGSDQQKIIFIKNIGSTDKTLHLAIKNWYPLIGPSSITISWDKEGSSIGVGEVVQATINLAVSNQVKGIGYFGFDLEIQASG